MQFMPFSLIPGAAPPQYPHDLPLRPVHGRVLGRGDIGREEGLPSIMRDAQCFLTLVFRIRLGAAFLGAKFWS